MPGAARTAGVSLFPDSLPHQSSQHLDFLSILKGWMMAPWYLLKCPAHELQLLLTSLQGRTMAGDSCRDRGKKPAESKLQLG